MIITRSVPKSVFGGLCLVPACWKLSSLVCDARNVLDYKLCEIIVMDCLPDR